MRVLLAYGSEPHYMAPPRLAEAQVNCGPFFFDRRVGAHRMSLATPRGDYDIRKVLSRLPPEQQPDVLAVHVDGSSMAGTPANLDSFAGPKVLLVADTHHGHRPISRMIQYAKREKFDRIILVYDRHHVGFFRAAGLRNIHWFPALTFAHSDARVRLAAGVRRVPQIALVGTVGYHPRRIRIFSNLVSQGLPLSWKQIEQSEAIAHYAGSLIGLNASMNGDLNMRVFEILAGGAMLLTDRLAPASGLFDLFTDGRELVSFESVPDLLERARYYLDHPEEAIAIGKAGADWFEEHFSEAKRQAAFSDIAFSGRDRPEFVLPKDASPEFAARPSPSAMLAAYEYLQELHKKRETVTVSVAGPVAGAVEEAFSTLPRVKFQSEPAGSEGFAVVSAADAKRSMQGQHVWVWDAAADSRNHPAASQPSLYRPVGDGAVILSKQPPESGDPLVDRARAAIQQGNLSLALQLAREAIQPPKPKLEGYFILAELAAGGGNWTLAKSMVDQARALDPSNPRIALWLRSIQTRTAPSTGEMLLAAARRACDTRAWEHARSLGRRAIQQEPKRAAGQYLNGLVAAYGELDGLPSSAIAKSEALGFFRVATELEPGKPDYWFERGLVAQDLGRHHEAIECFEQCLKHEQQAEIWSGLAASFLAMGWHLRAANACERALAIVPADAVTHGLLKLAMERRGEKAQVAAAPLASPAVDSPALGMSSPHRPWSCEVDSVLFDDSYTADHAMDRILSIFDAVAGSGRVFDGTGLRGGVLMAYQPWLGLDLREVLRAAHAASVPLVHISGAVPLARASFPKVTAENYLQLEHRGVNLWRACRYELAKDLCKMPEGIEPEAEADQTALSGLYVYAAAFIDKATSYFAHFRPETVVVGQGYQITSAILREIGLAKGLRVIALENVFHRERLLWDDISGIAVNKNAARNYYWRFQDVVTATVAAETVERYLQDLHHLKSAQHACPKSGDGMVADVPLPVVTYLAQVSVDSSVQFGLRGFVSQVEVIIALLKYAGSRPVRLLVKLHPKENLASDTERGFPRGLTFHLLKGHPEFAELVRQLGDRIVIDYENSFDTFEMIARSAVCVTINSQAGLEAAVLGREVVVCGDAFYGALGFTHEATDAPSLAFTLDRVLREGLKCNIGGRAARFFHIFTELYCIPKTPQALLKLLVPDAHPRTRILEAQDSPGPPTSNERSN